MTHIEQISNRRSARLVKHGFNEKVVIRAARDKGISVSARSEVKGVKGIIAAVLIVLWLLGFLAFHVSSSVLHVLLVIGIVMLIAHFFRGRTVTS